MQTGEEGGQPPGQDVTVQNQPRQPTGSLVPRKDHPTPSRTVHWAHGCLRILSLLLALLSVYPQGLVEVYGDF